MEQTAPPYWRLSIFYLIYFASIGALVPYWSLYLKGEGFSVSEIGEMMAIIMGTKIIAPNIWGWIADHTGQRMRIIRLASILSLLAFLGVYINSTYALMATVMFFFSFFWNANLPQLEATTLSHLQKQTHKYSTIRLWGSIGFILTAVSLGSIAEQYGNQWIPHTVLMLLVGIFIFSLITPDKQQTHHDTHSVSLKSVLTQSHVIALFAVCFLLQASHGPYYSFYTIYLEEHDYSRSLIGYLWALGVVAEIVVFMFMHQLLPRFGAKRLLAWALLLTAIRWFIVATSVESHAIMIMAQLLHAASFGLYHAVAIHLVHCAFPGRLQGRGQALYSSLSFGAGGAVGALYGGYVWESGGGFAAFTIGAVLCLLGWLITLRYIQNPKEEVHAG